MEYAAFGKELERARFRYFDRLAKCGDGQGRILMLGDGDGRGTQRACQVAPDARIDLLDSSAGMLRRAAGRLTAEERRRVTLLHQNAVEADYPPGGYDAVATLFFLDCLTPREVALTVERASRALKPGGIWLFADFIIPPAGWRRWRAVAWMRVLYTFFGWQTGLKARQLPPSEALLRGCGLRETEATEFHHGFLRTVVFEKSAGSPPLYPIRSGT